MFKHFYNGMKFILMIAGTAITVAGIYTGDIDMWQTGTILYLVGCLGDK